jgi:tetratricopeptide (TPR) repeat protein
VDPPKAKKGRDGGDQVRGRNPELPDAEVLKKNLYARASKWIRRKLGRRAERIFYLFFAALVVLWCVLDAMGKLPQVEKSLEMIPGFSSVSEVVHNQLHPIPKADSARFSVALAHLQNDDDRNMEGFIARALKNFDKPLGVQFLQFDRTITLKDQTDTSEKAGHEQARRYLKESGAQALIWGSAWTANGKSDAQLYYTTAGEGTPSAEAYQPENFKLPVVQRKELTDVLGLVVATQAAGFSVQEGRFIADKLKPFIDRVQLLLNGSTGQDWIAETRARINFLLGNALATFGQQKGEAKPLYDAANAYREALMEWPRERVPLKWARTQHNLGSVLERLGERESSTTLLEEAIAADHEALKELTRERVPFEWAMTLSNLGNALEILGEWKSDSTLLEEAVAAQRDALMELTRERVPLQWAMTQNNLGAALRGLGRWESSTTRLEEAVAADREALKEWTRERVPRDWATAQDNLGGALEALGEQESDSTRLEEAVAAYREALKERTCERVPSDWAATQTNLGIALEALGEQESDSTRLEEAVAAYREALKEWTRERFPLKWAATQNNLGGVLTMLGERESSTTRLEEAVAACHEALKEQTRERRPLEWAGTQNNLGAALEGLGELESGTTRLEEAVAAYHEALREWTRERVPHQWGMTQINLGNVLRILGQRKTQVAPVCESLGHHVAAWEVFSGASPYYASKASEGASKDIVALKELGRSSYEHCLAKYADTLKRMNLALVD